MAYWKNAQAYYNYAYGRSIDTDGYPKSQPFQCFDEFADFCIKNGLNVNLLCSITGYAGDLYKLRYKKGYDKYFEFFYPKHAEKGDWIFWSGHVAMVWDVDLANDRVLCLGQNQSGHPYVDLKWYKLSTALGCMRFKEWMQKMTGWVKSGSHWYYFDKDGNKVTGWKVLPWSKGKDWFYFNSDGVMQTGWITHKGGLYYCDEANGNMLTGSHTMTLQFGRDGGLI